MKVLNILSCGYRATLEEQDDTVAWISQAMRRAGADLDLLLRGAATNYVVDGQAVAPLCIGGRAQRHAPDLQGQLRDLLDSGAGVYAVAEDLALYGVADAPRLAEVRLVPAADLTRLIEGYDRVWHW